MDELEAVEEDERVARARVAQTLDLQQVVAFVEQAGSDRLAGSSVPWRPDLELTEWVDLAGSTQQRVRATRRPSAMEFLATVPLHVWMKVEVTPLSPHPNDLGNPTN